MIVKVWLGIGYGKGASHDDELEMDDNATDEEISEEVQDWANNYIEIGWCVNKEIK